MSEYKITPYAEGCDEADKRAIAKRLWWKFEDYLSANEKPFVTMRDFIDWLDREEE